MIIHNYDLNTKTWTDIEIPDPEPMFESELITRPTEMDKIEAQVLYTALMTGTYIGGESSA